MPATDLLHLADQGVRLAIERRTGAVAELESAATGWRIQGGPQQPDEAVAGFRLLIPLPGRRNNLALAEEQEEAPEVRQVADSEVVLSWRQVRSRHGGLHPIGVTQRICVRAGQVIFETTVENRSEYVVENVWAPCLGDLRPPDPDDELRSFCFAYGSATELGMWPRFESICGYWGVDHPTQTATEPARGGFAPVSPFMLVLARGQGLQRLQGLYIGVAERRADLVTWHSQLVPGYGDSMLATPGPDLPGHPRRRRAYGRRAVPSSVCRLSAPRHGRGRSGHRQLRRRDGIGRHRRD